MKKLIAVTAVVLAGICTNAATSVWIEGESALKTNLSANPWMKGDNPKLLSGGDAFACLNDNSNPLPKPGFVLWKIDVPEAGDYQAVWALFRRRCPGVQFSASLSSRRGSCPCR